MDIHAQNQLPHQSWNLGRIIGPKPPLKPRHIWAIRTRLQHDGRVRDLAMFNLAIDSCEGAISFAFVSAMSCLGARSGCERHRSAEDRAAGPV